jgi:hypothetical protein
MSNDHNNINSNNAAIFKNPNPKLAAKSSKSSTSSTVLVLVVGSRTTSKLSQQERPYHDDSTASRPLCEVKHHRARLVLRWGTTLESRVLFFSNFSLIFRTKIIRSLLLYHFFPLISFCTIIQYYYITSNNSLLVQ